jgi:hypothetical protein
MKRRIYFIPGWGETKKFKYSKKLIDALKKNFMVFPVSYISRKGASPKENLKLISKQIKKSSSNDILIGFSIGAVFVYIISQKKKFKKVLICSILPILEKDIKQFPGKEILKIFSQNEIEEYSSFKYKKLINNTTFLCGDKELETTIKKAKWLYKNFGGKILIVKDGKHNLDSIYIEKITSCLDLL